MASQGNKRLTGEEKYEGRNVKKVDFPVFIGVCLGLKFASRKDANEGRNVKEVHGSVSVYITEQNGKVSNEDALGVIGEV